MKQFILLVSSAVLLSSCVVNVEEQFIDKSAHRNAAQFTSLTYDGGSLSSKLVINGINRDTLSAYARASVWANNDEDARRIAEGMNLSWVGAADAQLKIEYPGTEQEFVRIEGLTIDAPKRLHVNIDVSSTDLEIHDMEGNITADVSSGDIDVTTTGRIDLESSSGDIIATSGRGGTIDVSSGDIIAEVTSRNFDELDIESSSGDVTVRLASGAGIDLELETSSGSISVDYDGFVSHESDGRIFISLNGGGRRVRVEASSGNILLTRY